MCIRSHLQQLNFQSFPGGTCPQIHLGGWEQNSQLLLLQKQRFLVSVSLVAPQLVPQATYYHCASHQLWQSQKQQK